MGSFTFLKYSLVVLCGLGVSSVIFYRIYSHEPVTKIIKDDDKLMKVLLSQYPLPVSVSPDNSKVLIKNRHEAEFEIAVLDRLTGQKIQAQSSLETQLSLTWKPDGNAIVYVASHSGDRNYRLHYWNLKTGTDSVVSDLVTFTAAPPLRWNPSGNKLAVYVGDSEDGNLIVLDPEKNSERITVGKTSSDKDFCWSPDGQKLAYVDDDIEGLLKISPIVQTKEKAFQLNLGEIIKDLAWSSNGKFILATVREKNDEFFYLKFIDLDSSSVKTVAKMAFDIGRPVWASDSLSFFFEVNRNGITEIWRQNLQGKQELVSDSDNVYHILENPLYTKEATQDLKVYINRLDSPPTIGSISIKSKKIKVLFDSPHSVPILKLNLKPDFISLTSKDGMKIPAMVWKDKADSNPVREGIIYVHGGPHLQESPAWDPRNQYLLKKGAVLITVNYRGSKGYGYKYGEMTKDIEGQAQDILAAQEYFKDTYGLTPDRTVLMATSFGNLVALKTLSIAPQSFGSLVLISAVKINTNDCPKIDHLKHIYEFQGREDNIASPTQVYKSIFKCFGPLYNSPANSWHVFEDEGHFYQRTRSWTTVYTSISELLEE